MPPARTARLRQPCKFEPKGAETGGGLLTLPCGGIIRIRFKGTLSPAANPARRTPNVRQARYRNRVWFAMRKACAEANSRRPVSRPASLRVIDKRIGSIYITDRSVIN